MANFRSRRRLVFACFMPLLALAFISPTPTQGQDEAVSKAVTIKDDSFLTIPAKLDSNDFVVAKTAPEVDVCFFADLKDKGKGTLWSSWGDGCVASNGKYYTSVGDHLGKDANSYIYEYDPMTRVLRRVVDVLRAIGHVLGLFGHGKVHSGIHEAADGKLYFTTYWGKQGEVEKAYATGKFDGSLLLRYDPKTGKTDNLGAIVDKQGLPASIFDANKQLLYFHAVYKGDVAVYDVKAQKVKFQGGAGETVGHRTFMTDAQGRTYFSGKEGFLLYYDPAKNDIVHTKLTLPLEKRVAKKKSKAKVDDQPRPGSLRAAVTRPAKDGTIYGMTAQGQMFAFNPSSQTIKDLGPNFVDGDYTAVMVMSPDEKYLYYAPGAHGSGVKTGVPVVQYDIATGKRKVLAFLHDTLKKRLDYITGGTYNVQIDPAGDKLYITFNGAGPTARNAFGKPAVVVLHIPASER